MRPRAALAGVLLSLTALAAAEDGTLELIDVDGFRDALDARQGQIVVVNLWATWCVPCLREIPILMQLEEEMAAQGVALVALGVEDPYDLARVDAFRREHFPAFSSYLRDTPDLDAIVSVIDPAWNEIMPTTYLLRADGSVAKRIQGKLTLEQFRAEISALFE